MFGSLNFYLEHSKFSDLLNSIRSKCESCATWPDPAKAIRASLVRFNISMQILLTDLYIFLQSKFGEFVKRSKQFPMIIISLLILITMWFTVNVEILANQGQRCWIPHVPQLELYCGIHLFQ